ncbi:MAG: hypothetical protein RLZZ323_1327 [Bacteroidota bacterium]|jgi:uncharacterized protein
MKKYKLSIFNEIAELDLENNSNDIILFAMRSGKIHKMTNDIYELLKNGHFELIPTNILSELIRDNAIVRIDDDETVSVLKENDLMVKENRNLYFVIQPGANCQLGCGYCGQTHTKKQMTLELMDKVVKRIESKIIASTSNADTLSITWYGAEPLLALAQIRYLSPKLISLSKKYKLNYDPDIITNALGLKENILKELIEINKIRRFQITIDGNQENHDKRRYTKTGEPTFNIILNNLINLVNNEYFIKYSCVVLLRINIDKTNCNDVIPFINFLASKNIQKHLRLDFAPIVDWGGNKASSVSLTRDNLAEHEINWFMEALKLGFMVDNFIPNRGPACMVVNPTSEVYDAYGEVTPCYEMNYTDLYKDTEHIIGNLNSNVFSEKISPLRNWHTDIIQNYPCYTCKFLPVCGGSCPKNWLKNEPTCPTFKFNMGDRLILEYLKKKGKLLELIQS